MADTPLVWDLNQDIIIEIFVTNPNTSLGLTGQTSFITLTIERNSDSKFWSGSAWGSSSINLTVTEVDSTNQPGRYNYMLTGNTQADRYIAHVNINNPPTIQADAYEVHISRNLDVRVYESEAE